MLSYKEYQEAWLEYPKKHIVLKYPLQIDFDLTSRCNLKCPKCPFHSKNAIFKRKPEDLDFELYKQVIDEVSGKIYGIKFSFSGEPLLYKKLPEAVMYARQKGVMDVRLNSNGLMMNKRLAIRLIISGLTMFILSDYDIPEQIEKAQILQDMKILLHFDMPVLVVKTEHPERWKGIADDIQPHIWFDYHNISANHAISKFECEQPWQRILVLANGDVCRCSCGTTFPDKVMGNIEFDTIQELWHSEYMKYLRWCHENHCSELVVSCLKCPGRIDWIWKSELKDVIENWKK